MKPVSPELLSLLATRQWYQADLYVFTLANNGGTLRYCSGDSDIMYNGNLYPATGIYGSGTGGPYFGDGSSSTLCHWKIGTDVDTLQFDVFPGDAQLFGVPFLTAIQNAAFRGATMTLYRAFMKTYGDTTVGALNLFSGRVADVVVGRAAATFTVNSWLDILNQQFPRNLYQYNCMNNLGDAACGVNVESFVLSSTVTADVGAGAIQCYVDNATAGFFDQGKVTMTGGVLAGLSRSIRGCSFGNPGYIYLIAPFPSDPKTGDTLKIYAGCDKTRGTNGCPKFNNLARFRGFPFIPQPSVSI